MSSSATVFSGGGFVGGDLKRFLYIGTTLALAESTSAYAKLLGRVSAQCRATLAAASASGDNHKLDEILAVLKEFATKIVPNNRGMDTVAFVLAALCKCAKTEAASHKIYETLIQTSPTPYNLFAFEFYLSYLKACEAEASSSSSMDVSSSGGAAAASVTTNSRKKERRIGRGHKKALVKWYATRGGELELARILTKYKHSHSWTNKDLFKLIHMKPQNEASDYVMKYVMFGFDKVKDDKLPESFASLTTFVQDLENLKTVKTGEEISQLIRKNKFHKEHLPSRIYKFKEIWPALIEQMSIYEFCSSLPKFINKDVLGPEHERFIMDKILNKEASEFKNASPIYLCLGVQIIDNMLTHSSLSQKQQQHRNNGTNSGSIISSHKQYSKEGQQHRSVLERLRDHMWHLYSHSVQLIDSKMTLRVMIVIEVNGQMRNAHTLGLGALNPIDTSACIMLTLYYANANVSNVAVFAASDKLTQLELTSSSEEKSITTTASATSHNHSRLNHINATPDLGTIERIFQGFASIEKNPTDKIFEWSLQNAKSYDAFVFLTGSDQNYNQILSETEFYRIHHWPSTKLVLINLTGKNDSPPHTQTDLQTSINESSLNLCINGWSFDHYFVLDSFLKGKF